MKVLFESPTPFMLAHGGSQVQIEQTRTGLERLGIEVEPLRWWDEHQTADVLHYFGRIPTWLLRLAHDKGWKVVMTLFLGSLGARPPARRWLQKVIIRILRRASPGSLAETLGWNSFLLADGMVAMTPWEAFLMQTIFQAPPSRIHVIPNGVEEVFFNGTLRERGQWLVSTSIINEQKQILKVAQMAVLAKTPFWAIGKPFSETDPYFRQFLEFARSNPKFVRYEGAISERARLAEVYREARGFVLLSKWESLSLSALEAAACGCPLLLSDFPWARWSFKENASYCPALKPIKSTVHILRDFYDQAPRLRLPPRPLSWQEVSQQLAEVYQGLFKTSR